MLSTWSMYWASLEGAWLDDTVESNWRDSRFSSRGARRNLDRAMRTSVSISIRPAIRSPAAMRASPSTVEGDPRRRVVQDFRKKSGRNEFGPREGNAGESKSRAIRGIRVHSESGLRDGTCCIAGLTRQIASRLARAAIRAGGRSGGSIANSCNPSSRPYKTNVLTSARDGPADGETFVKVRVCVERRAARRRLNGARRGPVPNAARLAPSGRIGLTC